MEGRRMKATQKATQKAKQKVTPLQLTTKTSAIPTPTPPPLLDHYIPLATKGKLLPTGPNKPSKETDHVAKAHSETIPSFTYFGSFSSPVSITPPDTLPVRSNVKSRIGPLLPTPPFSLLTLDLLHSPSIMKRMQDHVPMTFFLDSLHTHDSDTFPDSFKKDPLLKKRTSHFHSGHKVDKFTWNTVVSKKVSNALKKFAKEEFKSVLSSKRSSLFKERKCFNCFFKGHSKSSCRLPKRCIGCFRFGHCLKQCMHFSHGSKEPIYSANPLSSRHLVQSTKTSSIPPTTSSTIQAPLIPAKTLQSEIPKANVTLASGDCTLEQISSALQPSASPPQHFQSSPPLLPPAGLQLATSRGSECFFSSQGFVAFHGYNSSPVPVFTGPLQSSPFFKGFNCSLTIPVNIVVATHTFQGTVFNFSLSPELSIFNLHHPQEIFSSPDVPAFEGNQMEIVIYSPLTFPAFQDCRLNDSPLAVAMPQALNGHLAKTSSLSIQIPAIEGPVFEDSDMDQPTTPVWPSKLTVQEELAQFTVRRSPRLIKKADGSYSSAINKAQAVQFGGPSAKPKKKCAKNKAPQQALQHEPEPAITAGPPTLEQAKLVLKVAGVPYNEEVKELMKKAGVI